MTMATLKDFLKRLAVPANKYQEYEGEETEPLCTDNTKVSQQSPCHKPTIDGKLTSRILIASMIPVTLVVVVVFSFLSIADHEKNTVSRSIVNSVCGISSLFMISLFCLSRKFGKKITKPGHDDYLSHAPKIVFTWLFGVSLLFDSGLRITENVDNIVDNKTNIYGHFPRNIFTNRHHRLLRIMLAAFLRHLLFKACLPIDTFYWISRWPSW